MAKKYKTLFFDLDNTLWDFEKNSFLAMKETVKTFGLEFNETDFENFFTIYTIHNAYLWDAYRKNEISKNELTYKRFQLTFNDYNLPNPDFQQMNSVYLNYMGKQTNLIEYVPEILEYLKKRGYDMYIITNGFREVQQQKLINSGIDSYFKKIFISEVVQAQKPAKEIFEFAVKSANAKKSSSLMIGDDWNIDIIGAVNYGIDAVYLCNKKPDIKTNISYKKEIFYIYDILSIKKIL